jgi:hypothetical protein
LRPNTIQQLLKSRPLHRPAGEADVVISLSNDLRSLMSLALDIAFRSLALVVEGFEVLL